MAPTAENWPSRLVWTAALAFVVPLVGHARVAHAESPGCAKADVQKAMDTMPANNVAGITTATLEALNRCKGRLTSQLEADTLFHLLLLFESSGYEDLEGCRRVADLGLGLDRKEVGYTAEQVAQFYGRCGGDCNKVKDDKSRRSCEREGKILQKELTGKLAPEIESEQAVPCDPKKARKLVEGMDRLSLREQALRFMAKYHASCGKAAAPKDLEALANDEALVNFHNGNDADCLKTLDAIANASSPASAFNRALCGGTCTLEAPTCTSAADARKKALAERVLREKLRQVTQAYCWRCTAGKTCTAPRRDEIYRGSFGESHALNWDLKPFSDGVRGRYNWIEDINGDGIGDLMFEERNVQEDLSSYALDGIAKWPDIKYRRFTVYVGCGESRYMVVFDASTNREPYTDHASATGPWDDYALRITDKTTTPIKSTCVYEDHDIKCTKTKCDGKAVECADLHQWENTVRSAR